MMMWVSKVPNYDAYGLFRALHSHNPFYAPLRSVAKHVTLAHSTPVFAYRGIITLIFRKIPADIL